MLLYRLDDYRPALAALERYVELRPDALDREQVEEHIGALRMMLAA